MGGKNVRVLFSEKRNSAECRGGEVLREQKSHSSKRKQQKEKRKGAEMSDAVDEQAETETSRRGKEKMKSRQ